jgi:hypothetical protein
MKPLDNLLHLPPEAAPVQKAIDLVKEKPLEAAVCRSDSGRLSIFVRWLSRCPGMATRRVMPLRSRAFSDLRFSPPERHPGTIRGNKDRHSRPANECVCVAPGGGAGPSVVKGGKAMDYRQVVRKRLSAVHLALHE